MVRVVTIKITIQQTHSIVSYINHPRPSSQNKTIKITTVAIVISNRHPRGINGMRRRPRGRGDSSHRSRPSFKRWRRNRGSSRLYRLRPSDLSPRIRGISAITLYPRPGLKLATTLIPQQIMRGLWAMVESLLSRNIETAVVAR
jgi:hypothetical protein